MIKCFHLLPCTILHFIYFLKHFYILFAFIFTFSYLLTYCNMGKYSTANKVRGQLEGIGFLLYPMDGAW